MSINYPNGVVNANAINIGNAQAANLGAYVPSTTYGCWCGNTSCNGNHTSAVGGYLTYPSTSLQNIYTSSVLLDPNNYKDLHEFITQISTLSEVKLKELGALLKRNVSRYKALDEASNLARELGRYDAIVLYQNNIWNQVSQVVGARTYNVRDVIWDGVMALALKKELKESVVKTLYKPVLLMGLSSDAVVK